jgi:hypothetical protein
VSRVRLKLPLQKNVFFRSGKDGLLLEVIDYFLALFPVFTLSTNFPIIAITLRYTIVYKSRCFKVKRQRDCLIRTVNNSIKMSFSIP